MAFVLGVEYANSFYGESEINGPTPDEPQEEGGKWFVNVTDGGAEDNEEGDE